MAIANTKVFGKHFDRDINRIFFDEYAGLPTEYDKIVEISGAPPGNHYTEAELTPLGALREVPEGTGIQFDDAVEGHEKTVYYTEHGLGFQITQHMMKDDLTQNFKRMPKKLAKSAVNKIETQVAGLFNAGFVTTTHTAWDGKAIFTTDHTTLKSGDTIDNDPTAASLSETSVQAGFEYADTLVDEAGYPLLTKPVKLCIPTELRATAGRLFGTDRKLGSANWDVNLASGGNMYDLDVYVNHFFTSSTAWFILLDIADFRLMWKEKPVMESSDDFFTGNALFKINTRFVVFCNDYKGGYGNSGS